MQTTLKCITNNFNIYLGPKHLWHCWGNCTIVVYSMRNYGCPQLTITKVNASQAIFLVPSRTSSKFLSLISSVTWETMSFLYLCIPNPCKLPLQLLTTCILVYGLHKIHHQGFWSDMEVWLFSVDRQVGHLQCSAQEETGYEEVSLSQ